ncbi:glycosyltransferase family 2 protein [Qipengyuania sp. MTN3-11]|uniref:glycosyltransferase family 2 protein n=1 Tax=Qipengyuania sp. MTN3-11 TaxID=3056557 RepID=UPI0036F2D5D5
MEQPAHSQFAREACESVAAAGTGTEPELSIVIPCLNEAETLATCIVAAQRFLRAYDVQGEIIVADNGSTDGSQAIARELGAQVIDVAERGYGAALRAGIAAAQTPFVAMADGDDSYDFMGLMPFLVRLREGYDLVMGNRFMGGIARGAMPPLHKYLGNPALSMAGRVFYRAPVGDFHCGLRAFRREAILGLGLSSTGMEFASEMVVKAQLSGLSMTEVPTTLKPDGRSRAPHLRSFRDGWRHLKFLLIFAPRWLYLYPGLALAAAGLIGFLILLPGFVSLGSVRLGVNSLLFCGLSLLLGVQLVSFGLLAKLFGTRERYWMESRDIRAIRRWLTIDKTCIAGGGLFVAGIAGSTLAVWQWGAAGYGDMVAERLLRLSIPSALACAIGIQIAFTGFLAELMNHPARLRSTGATA